MTIILALTIILFFVLVQLCSIWEYKEVNKIIATILLCAFLLPFFVFTIIIRYHTITIIIKNGTSEKSKIIKTNKKQRDRIVCYFEINNLIVSVHLRIHKINKKILLETCKEGNHVNVLYLKNNPKKMVLADFYR